MPYFCVPLALYNIIVFPSLLKLWRIKAEVAHLVEHDLAKVGVAGSSPVFRSGSPVMGDFFWKNCPGGETGRHAGLKILWAARPVRVQLPPGAHSDQP